MAGARRAFRHRLTYIKYPRMKMGVQLMSATAPAPPVSTWRGWFQSVGGWF